MASRFSDFTSRETNKVFALPRAALHSAGSILIAHRVLVFDGIAKEIYGKLWIVSERSTLR